jgi:hypothetical protein
MYQVILPARPQFIPDDEVLGSGGGSRDPATRRYEPVDAEIGKRITSRPTS